MTRRVYHVDIARVVIHGVRAGRLDPRELRSMVERAVASALADTALPAGPTMRAAVQLGGASLATGGAAAVADAVAAGVARAAGKGHPRG